MDIDALYLVLVALSIIIFILRVAALLANHDKKKDDEKDKSVSYKTFPDTQSQDYNVLPPPPPPPPDERGANSDENTVLKPSIPLPQNHSSVPQNTIDIVSERENTSDLRDMNEEKKIRAMSEDEILRELEDMGYEEIEFCARGGMAILYTVKDPNLNFKKVCVKIAYSETNPIKVCVEKIKEEYKALKELKAVPEVPTCFYSIEKESLVGIVMEYIEGEIIGEYVKQNISKQEKISILVKLLMALKRIHTFGYIHRDINPNNILISGGKVKLIDFGTTTLANNDKTGGTIVMTGFYSAPEQVSGDDVKALPQSDIYSIGAVMYYLYAGEDPKRFMWSLKRSDMSDKGIPPNIIEIIRKATEFDPENRYKDCDEFISDLDRILDDRALFLKIHDDKILVHDDGLDITTDLIGLDAGDPEILARVSFDFDKHRFLIEKTGSNSWIYIFNQRTFVRKKKYYLDTGDIISLFYERNEKRYFPIMECEVS